MNCYVIKSEDEEVRRNKEYPYQKTRNTESIGQCRAFSIEIDLDSCVPKASESKLIVLNALALAQKESYLVGI